MPDTRRLQFDDAGHVIKSRMLQRVDARHLISQPVVGVCDIGFQLRVEVRNGGDVVANVPALLPRHELHDERHERRDR
jgi:hypothetical protein